MELRNQAIMGPSMLGTQASSGPNCTVPEPSAPLFEILHGAYEVARDTNEQLRHIRERLVNAPTGDVYPAFDPSKETFEFLIVQLKKVTNHNSGLVMALRSELGI